MPGQATTPSAEKPDRSAPVKILSSTPVRDEDDYWVLVSALAVKADVLVTGDKDLLDVANEVSGMKITDPRGFWNIAKKRP